MPKVVDHDTRRRELVEATWRVIRRNGVDSASVRGVAAEAGWSPGSVRYYFPSQSALIAFAMEVVADRVRERLTELDERPDVLETVELALEQVLPLDPERRAETEVWLEFVVRAQVAADLRDRRDAVHRELRAFVRRSLRTLAAHGLIRPGLSLEDETSRLHALLDGLALHAVTSPATTTPGRLRSALRAHLASLLR